MIIKVKKGRSKVTCPVCGQVADVTIERVFSRTWVTVSGCAHLEGAEWDWSGESIELSVTEQ